jgi:putative transcriptional regulator
MTIRITLDKVLGGRDMSLTALSDKVGLTIANLSILKTGKARAIRFSTLDALCRALDCQPGDILVFDPSEVESDGGRGD